VSSLKNKIAKRISPIPLMFYELRKDFKGFRSKRTARKHGEPIDMHGADHLHIYMTLVCNLNCYFCINKILVDSPVKYGSYQLSAWVDFLNRLHGIRELYFNGGEHFLIKGFSDVINSLDNFNVLIFTNLPEKGLDEISKLKKHNNNIILKMSYHPLNDVPINQYIKRTKIIPKGILWNPHIIRAEGVSTGMYLDRFRREGILATSDELVYNIYMKHRLARRVLCRTNEHIIGPDMKMYRCLVHLLNGKNAEEIDDYSFMHEYIECNYFPKCNTCSAYNDIEEIE